MVRFRIPGRVAPLAALLGCALTGMAQERLAIVNARLEVGDGKVIEKGSVLIEGGKIREVGAAVSIPEGTKTIDGAGMIVYPGFIDAYSTRGLKVPAAAEAKTPPATREHAPATMWRENRRGIRSEVQAAKCLDLGSQLSDWHSQGFTAALLAPGSGLLRGTCAIAILKAGEAASTVLVSEAAHEMSFRGTGGGGPGGGGGGGAGGYPGSLMGNLALFRQTLHDARQYGLEKASANGSAPPAAAEYDNLQSALAGTVFALFSADTDREIARLLTYSREFGLKPMLFGGREAYKRAAQLKAAGVSVILSLDLGVEPPLTASGPDDTTPKAVREERRAAWMERTQNAATLAASGIRIAFASEGDTLGSFLKNMRRQIALGLPRSAALAAVTSGAAEALGLSARLGSIEPGKDANLTIFSGDFADEKSEVKLVVVGGTLVEIGKPKNPQGGTR